MNGGQDAAHNGSSTNTSSTGSFENVSVSGCSAMTETNDDASNGEGDDRKHAKEAVSKRRESEQDQFYTPTHTRSAISNLIRFSAAMFVLPLLTMFTTYHYVFRDYFDLPPDRAMLYAGICGISVVFVIVAAFVYVAYREEQEDEKVKLSTKKSN